MINYNDIKHVHVEVSSGCNASCPNCPRNVHGGYLVPTFEVQTMNFQMFKSVFDVDFVKQLDRIKFCGNYGDPIAASDLPKMLEYLFECNPEFYVDVNTNSGIRSTAWWSRIGELSSKYDLHIIFSIDGLEDTNHIYRKGVVWRKLESNFKAFISAGGKAIWDFLVFRHNEHQVEIARNMSKEYGFTEFRIKRPLGFSSYELATPQMLVIDKEGNLDYIIYESSKYVNEQKVTHTATRNDKFKFSANDYMNNMNARRDTDFTNSFSFLDNTEISCITKNYKEVYVSAAGDVYPCCFIGQASQINSNPDNIVLQKWLDNNVNRNKINAHKYSMREVIEYSYMSKIEESWKDPHTTGRPPHCANMCPNSNLNPVNQLYVKE